MLPLRYWAEDRWDDLLVALGTFRGWLVHHRPHLMGGRDWADDVRAWWAGWPSVKRLSFAGGGVVGMTASVLAGLLLLAGSGAVPSGEVTSAGPRSAGAAAMPAVPFANELFPFLPVSSSGTAMRMSPSATFQGGDCEVRLFLSDGPSARSLALTGAGSNVAASSRIASRPPESEARTAPAPVVAPLALLAERPLLAPQGQAPSGPPEVQAPTGPPGVRPVPEVQAPSRSPRPPTAPAPQVQAPRAPKAQGPQVQAPRAPKVEASKGQAPRLAKVEAPKVKAPPSPPSEAQVRAPQAHAPPQAQAPSRPAPAQQGKGSSPRK